jgi:protein-S-isoprenylcysteine O-methyltransferase
MTAINPLWIAGFFGVSEVVISTVLRSKAGSQSVDKGSLPLLWMTINVCMIGAIVSYLGMRSASFGDNETVYWIGVAVFVLGIVLRWYSIAYLGRFFTVDVAVAADHKVIDSGPYRFVRHPSYTGVLLAFFGVGLALANYVSLFLLTVPITAVFLHRIRVEEAALKLGLGAPYSRYMDKTRRLIPFLY